MKLGKLEGTIAGDRKGYFTILALLSTVGMLINSFVFSSPFIGTLLTVIYLFINSVFLGNMFFEEENTGFRMAFGLLILIMLIALGGATIIIASALFPLRLDTKMIVAVLISITIVISLENHLQIVTKSKAKVVKIRAYLAKARPSSIK